MEAPQNQRENSLPDLRENSLPDLRGNRRAL
jgi:hypothetical protein